MNEIGLTSFHRVRSVALTSFTPWQTGVLAQLRMLTCTRTCKQNPRAYGMASWTYRPRTLRQSNALWLSRVLREATFTAQGFDGVRQIVN